jgi:non-ribosomal peptide synthase protein (TIGR01720 family)
MSPEDNKENLSVKNNDLIPLPLFPIQLQSLARVDKNPHIFNLTYLIILQFSSDAEKLRMALLHVIDHHEALRLRFQHASSGWKTFIAQNNGPVPFSSVDLSALDVNEQSFAVEAKAAQFQSTLDLSDGPIIRAVYFDLGKEQAHRLLFMVHHFAFDAFSWPILLSDFFTAYKQLQQNEPVHLPPTTTSIKEYAEALATYAQSPALLEELDYWTTEPRLHIAPLPVDYPAGIQHPAIYRTVQAALSEKETKTLIALAKQRITIHDILLTALYKTYERWTGKKTTLIEVFQHGRLPLFEHIDLTRTIGYLSLRFPFLVDGSQSQGLRETALSIIEQYRRVPKGGAGYGVLRYLADSSIQQRLSQFPVPQWTLNYRGRVMNERTMQKNTSANPISQAKEEVRNTVSQQRIDARYLTVNSFIDNQQLHLSIQYQENIHKRTTINTLMQYLVESLRDLQQDFSAPPL